MNAFGLAAIPFNYLVRSRIDRAARYLLALSLFYFVGAATAAEIPSVGSKAPDFTLATPTGHSIRLSTQHSGSSLVVVVLRGFPGYQCPYCQRQVHDFIEHAAEFAAKKASVLLVYPGPPADLGQRANEFLATQSKLPSNVVLVIDPDYKVTNLYGLRWDAPHETAYPSTFIVDRNGTIQFEKISHSHGDRISAQDALDHLPAH